MSISCANTSNLATNSEVVDCVFGYSPNVGAAGFFLALFAVMAVVHAALALRSRSPIPAGLAFLSLCEVGGFIARLIAINNFSINTFIAMTVLLILPASLLAVADYRTLTAVVRMSMDTDIDSQILRDAAQTKRIGRIVHALTHPLLEDRRFNPEFVNQMFYILALAAAIVQIIGINNLSDQSSTSEVSRGRNLLLAGLAINLFTYAVFLLTMTYVLLSSNYDMRLDNAPGTRWLFWGMGITITILGVRQTYRLVQYCIGVNGYTSQHEAFYYCLDAFMAFSALVAFAAFDYGTNLARAAEEMAELHKDRKGMKVIAAPDSPPLQTSVAPV